MRRLGVYVAAKYLALPVFIFWAIHRMPGANEDYQFSLWDLAPFWGLILWMGAVGFVRPPALRIKVFPEPDSKPGTLVTRSILFALPFIFIASLGFLLLASHGFESFSLTCTNPPSAGLILGMYLVAVPLGILDFFYNRALIRLLEGKKQ